MIRFGVLNLIVGALQLSVPSYALRLLRRFGAQRVGWFLVICFAALGLSHLLEPLKPAGSGALSGVALDGIYGIASILLLIGMGHLETLFAERSRAQQQEAKLRADCKLEEEARTTSRQDLVQKIAHRTQECARLEESEAQYRFLFEESPEAMLIIDLRSLRFLTANRAALRLYGFTPEDIPLLTLRDLLPPEWAAAFAKDLTKPCSGVQFRGRCRHSKRDQTSIDVELSAMDLKYSGCPARLIVVNDVSLRLQRELKICQAQKMEVVAQLAGRFAHHFNNILTVIDGQADLLLQQPIDPTNAAQLRRISEAAKRAAALTSQLLAAGARQNVQMEPLDLNNAVRDLTPMLRRLVGESIRLETSLNPNLPPILADARVIEHIIVHLIHNARVAMGMVGTLSIHTSAVCFNATYAGDEHSSPARECVRLSVGDTGCGMTPEVQAHVFEPFFTTHDAGKASGLGLASIYGAVKQHSGWIEFGSEPGVGTEFRIFFPVAPVQTTVARKDSQVPRTAARETILLIQSNAKERELARFILVRNGYRVIEADCATTAVLLFESQSKNISLLLSDVSLQEGIPGPKLAAHLQKSKPELKVLFLAGPPMEDEEPILTEGLTLIPKPYGPERLLVAVQGCLAHHTSSLPDLESKIF